MTSLQNAKNINDKAEQLGEKYVDKGITSSQIRKIYSSIKKAQNEYKFENDEESAKKTLTMIKPHLAYAASRDDSGGMEEFMEDISQIIDDTVDGGNDLNSFFDLMEAIVAYHNYYDDKKGGRY